ncbi:Repeat containing protein [Teratosphaeria destructans]|uniref:Repeat containing protein n=1 Tax=Teratosphaeria destructans TaxID=418781 RepID=A0A9W7SJQ9_9PEZI|nr:Repeat containing protein [Teratosphaeria destructans]
MFAASRRHTRRDRQVDELVMRSKRLRATDKSKRRPCKTAMFSAFTLRQEARPRSRVLGAVSVCHNIIPRPYQPGSVARALIAQVDRALAPPVRSTGHCLGNAVIPTDEAGCLDEVHEEILSNAETTESSEDTAPESNDEPSFEADEVHEDDVSNTNVDQDSDVEIEDQEAEQNLEIEDPEIEDSEIEDPEIEDPEIEDPEIEDPEIEDSEIHEAEIVNTGNVKGPNAEPEDQQIEQNPEEDEDFALILDDDEIQYWLAKSRSESPNITTPDSNTSPIATHSLRDDQPIEPPHHHHPISRKHKRDDEDSDDHTHSPPKLAKHGAHDDKASGVRPGSRAAGGPSTCAHYTNVLRPDGRKPCTCPNYTDLGLDPRFRGPIYYRIADDQDEEGLPGEWIDGRWEFPDSMTGSVQETEAREEDEGEEEEEVVVVIDDPDPPWPRAGPGGRRQNHHFAKAHGLVRTGSTPSFRNYLPQSSSPATGANTSEEEDELDAYGETSQEVFTDLQRRRESASPQDDASITDPERPPSEPDQYQTTSHEASSAQIPAKTRSQTTSSERARRTPARPNQRNRAGKSRTHRSAPATSRSAPPDPPQNPRQMPNTTAAHQRPTNLPPTLPRAMRREVRARHPRRRPSGTTSAGDIVGFRVKGARGAFVDETGSRGEGGDGDAYARERRERDEQRVRREMRAGGFDGEGVRL